MAMEDDEDSEEDSSQDETAHHSHYSHSSNSANSITTSVIRSENYAHNDSGNRPPLSQPLFLNFTSDLSPQKLNKKKTKSKKQTAYRVNGVNILNRNELDSKTAIERIQRRRENHNHVERRRRDNINNTIFELSTVVPNAIKPGQKPNKGNILKLSLDYIRELKTENEALKERLNKLLSPPSAASSSPAINVETATAKHSVQMSVDEPCNNTNGASNNSTNSNHHQIHPPLQYQQYQNNPTSSNFLQQSPSAPNSPHRYGLNSHTTTFHIQPQHAQQQPQPQQQQQTISMSNSPVFTSSNSGGNNTMHHQALPPPSLSLPPPPTMPAPYTHQQIQHIFSNMSVSSPSPTNSTVNSSVVTSSPSISPLSTSAAARNTTTTATTIAAPASVPVPATAATATATVTANQQSGYPPFFPPYQTTASATGAANSISTPSTFHRIPQPPTLYNHNIENSTNNNTNTSNLRPLLPATDKSSSTAPFILPSLRMSGYEKIYGNVCRY
ncbi:hypothetical protein BDF20DRAFT_152821 [Mycotypha africana]|uniref:uncharacterized protein n=1 Tax=Mycotypha africana TaxID=64632 RepID=UPI0023015A5E|nr:uncharacterized protein BDF20DRAFT_152821 [Mycotypha africana]KAI8969244.1 hypothetical protein BDF20DRAFT_152821 [Mycotypha africana]